MPIQKTLTILNHGTMNSSGDDLVISRLKSLMVGVRGGDQSNWMLNTGVGSLAQAADRIYMPGWNALAGTLWAKGLNKNVRDSVDWVKGKCAGGGGAATVRVNMAGHSRGSMTALKIAYELQQDPATQGCEVNLFLIDPVPGNLGWVNSGMYKQIAIQANVQNASMILAETERRNCFKPYVDQMFLQDLPTHRMDTIPGNHGGINELSPKGRHESADVVLHQAVRFLWEHGTDFNNVGTALKNTAQLLELYATIMLNFQKYKAQGHASNNVVFLTMGGASKKDRKVQLHNANKKVGWGNVPGLDKNKYDSTPMKSVLAELNVKKESRFFANRDHKALFRAAFPTAFGYISELEQGGNDRALRLMAVDGRVQADVNNMGDAGREHLATWQGYLTA